MARRQKTAKRPKPKTAARSHVWHSTGLSCSGTGSSWNRRIAPSTINVRLAAVRRLAYEAADTGLLSPDLAAGIRRVKGAKRLGVRIGNWLTIDQARALLQQSSADALRSERDRAILAVLIGCGLRRAELVSLKAEDFEIREEHWVIADLRLPLVADDLADTYDDGLALWTQN